MMRIALCVYTLHAAAQQPAADPNRWGPAIQKFEAEDQATPPPKGGIVFIGASSIVRWTCRRKATRFGPRSCGLI
jgi:hypothetical protein